MGVFANFIPMKGITIAIVDDNHDLRKALEEIITMSDDLFCIGTMGTVDEALARIPALMPDIVLMDINLGEQKNGTDCVRVLKPLMPATNFMMCTVYEDDENIFEALRAGASAYILKKTEPSRLLEAIRELHQGGAPMSSQIAKKVVSNFRIHEPGMDPMLKKLSQREMEILEWLSKGLMYKEIASELGISIETVRKHVYRIYEKLHVNNRVAAVNKYFGR